VREKTKNTVKALFFLGGIFLLAVGINLMTTVPQFGLSPWDSLFIALRDNFGFTLGFWMLIVNSLFCGFVFIFKREYVSIGTVCIIFLISLFVDGLQALFLPLFLSVPDMLSFLLGAVFIGYGIGIYVSTSICFAPQEAFMLAVSEKLTWSYRKTEILASILVLFISFLLNGPIFWGTLFLTIAVGFIIQLALEQSRRLLTYILSF
jgi:uncharacterized protein